SLAGDYHDWLLSYVQRHAIPMATPEPEVRREDWVEPYFRQLGQRSGIAVVLKTREPELMAVHHARTGQITVESRHENLYYFYLNHPECGRMWLRICPYFPLNVQLWLNGHNWLACQLQREGIPFVKRDNLFLDCADPERLQQLAYAFGPQDIQAAVEPCLNALTPFFSAKERADGCRHQFYMAQMEYCHNLLFHQQAYAHRLI